MIMSWIWSGMAALALLAAIALDKGSALSAAVAEGAQAGITLALSMAGAVCLWSGVGKLMETVGITDLLAKLIQPLLYRLFPSAREDAVLRRSLTGNICANFLGLGNAATPMGIRAVKQMADPRQPGVATDQMCRLIVMNTASIQLIPANVAAVRSSLGCAAPFDILPMVWLTSLCSVSVGVCCAAVLGRLSHR